MFLVAGGAGYIGSHTVVALMEAGHDVLVLDNLCNSSRQALERVATLVGREVPFMVGDIRNEALLDRLFETHDITSVVHFAGLKAVGNSSVIGTEAGSPYTVAEELNTIFLTLARAMARQSINVPLTLLS